MLCKYRLKKGGVQSKLFSLAMSFILIVTLAMPSGFALAETEEESGSVDIALINGTVNEKELAASEETSNTTADQPEDNLVAGTKTALHAGLKVHIEAKGAAEGTTATVRVEAVDGDPAFAPIEREVPVNEDAVIAEPPALKEGATYSVGVTRMPAASDVAFSGGDAYSITLAENITTDEASWGTAVRHIKAPDEADRDDASVSWDPIVKSADRVSTDVLVTIILARTEITAEAEQPAEGDDGNSSDGDDGIAEDKPELQDVPKLESLEGKSKEETKAALQARVEAYANAVGPRASSVTYVSPNEESMTEGGWTQRTRYMEIDGQFAMCCTHWRNTPPQGSPAYVIGTVTNDDMRKVAWYGWGGPGDLGYSLVETACMMSNANGETPVVSVQDRLRNVLSKPSPPASFVVTKWSTGGVTQDMITWTYKPNGYLHFQKNSSNPEITDGNDCYTLAGAVYDLYKADGTYVRSITTPASGYVDLGEVEAGSYYFVERTAPAGYRLNGDRIWVTVVSEQTATATTTDTPYDDPVGALLQKADPVTGGTAQGLGTLAGAEFTVKFYAGRYDAGVDPAELGIEPTRTWVMATNANGWAYFDNNHVISGDPFYVGASGTPTFPLGTVTVQETKAPEGYLLSTPELPNKVYVQRITQDGIDGVGNESWNEHEILDQVKAAEAYITKVGTKIGDDVTEGGQAQAIPLPGVEFSLYSSTDYVDNGDDTYTVKDGANPYATIVTDENGIADTHYTPRPDGQHGALVFDKYLVVETKPAPNYDPIKPFVVDAQEDGKVYYFFANNTYVTSGVELVKVDAESGLPVLVAGTQFQVLDAAKNPIVWHQSYPEELDFDTLTVGASGSVLLPQRLNAGTYYLREVSAPEGYLLGHVDVPFTVATTADWDNPLEVKYADVAQKGSIKIKKVDAETGKPIPAAGIEWDLVAADDIVTGDGVVHVPAGGVAAKLVTGADGTATAGDLHLGRYLAYETNAPDGYVLNAEPLEIVLSYAGQEVDAAYSDAEFGNAPQKGVIEVSKADAESGLPVAVAGIGFRVTAASDIVTPDGTVRARAGETVAELVTGDDGKAETGELYLGAYEVVETHAPDGYVLNSDPVKVEIAYAGQETEVVRVGAVVEDKPQMGVIRIEKADETDGRPVPGAVYEVSAAEDVVTPDGTLHAHAGDVVATVVTGEDGAAETPELYLGSYDVVETSTPDGWAIDHAVHRVVLAYAGQDVEVTRSVLETSDAPTVFKLIKKAEQVDGEYVDYQGSEWRVWAEDEAGKIVFDTAAVTDEHGGFELARIPHANGLTYYCQETKTGDDYILDPEVYEFEVDHEGMIAGEPTYTLTNINYHKRIIDVTKVDENTGDPVGDTGFKLYKWIGEGEPDPTFGGRPESHAVYAKNPDAVDGALWELVAEGATDDMGSVIFEGLEFGWYMVVEAVPNPDYAEWWESAGSTWGSYIFVADKLSDVRQTQVFANEAITVECNVSKATIDRTSAAFQSHPGAPVRIDNVGKERYRYDVGFDAGETNVRADQYTVVDPCEFVDLGIRLDTLVTPVAYGDTDGLVNVWYRTNKTDTSAVYSSASATAGNPHNQMADGTDRISTVGWHLWREGVDAGARARLDVDGLGLSDGEYVTGIMLEYGSVEVGFRTLQDMSYLVYATKPLDNSVGEVKIPNSVTSHISRNWRDGRGLYDDARDEVFTRVIDTFAFSSSYHGTSTPPSMPKGFLAATGDRIPAVTDLAIMLVAAVLAVLAGIWITSRKKGEAGA